MQYNLFILFPIRFRFQSTIGTQIHKSSPRQVKRSARQCAKKHGEQVTERKCYIKKPGCIQGEGSSQWRVIMQRRMHGCLHPILLCNGWEHYVPYRCLQISNKLCDSTLCTCGGMEEQMHNVDYVPVPQLETNIKIDSAGDRTRVACVTGEHST